VTPENDTTVGGTAPDLRGPLRALSGLAVVSPVFLLAPVGDAYRWLDMSAVSSVLVVVAGLLGLAASTGRRELAVAAGALCLGGSAVRLVSLFLETGGPVGGSGSTMTFLAGLGLGFLVLGLAGSLPRRAG
jgi:hypothetical protein